jgi:hypothetical protein
MEMTMANEQKLVSAGSLDKLAKLLAAENIMVEHRPIKTAYFDVKNRVLALPMWKEMTETLYHMLVLHEVGHALDTPSDGWKGAIDKVKDEDSAYVAQTFKGYLNVVEDARIERKIKTKFPGSRRDVIEGYDWLHQQDFFSIKSREVNELSLIDRINLYFKLGTRIRIKFNDEEMSFVRRAEQTITFDDVIKLAEDLLAYAKKKKEEQDEEEPMSVTANGEFGEEDAEADTSRSSSNDKDEDKDERDSSQGGCGKQGSSSTKPIDQATTDEAMNDRMEELLDEALSNKKFDYIYFPKDLTHEEFTVGYREILKLIERDFSKARYRSDLESYRNKLLSKFRAENNSAINYMVKEFERKKAAVSYSRSKQAKTGVIDTNKLHSYKFSDDIFRRLTIEPTGKNHGIVAILDMSGSMQTSYRGAMEQLITLAMFCRRVGIPHRFYGFTQVMQTINHNKTIKKDAIMNRLSGKNFIYPDVSFDLIEFFHEGMSLKDFNTMVGSLLVSAKTNGYSYGADEIIDGKAINHWLQDKFGFEYHLGLQFLGLGGTPLNDAILVSRDLMAKFRKEKNIQIMNFVCITDGESNHSTYYNSSYGGNNSIKSNSRFYTGILIDEESKIQTSLNFENFADFTGILAKTVRQSQNASFVGFYIVANSYDLRHVSYRHVKYDDQTRFTTSWKKEKSAVVPNMINFDEFYIVQGGSYLQTQQAKIDDVGKEASKGQLTRAFITAQNKRGTSRAILGKFIEKISA